MNQKEILLKQKERIEFLLDLDVSALDFRLWKRETKKIIENIFGKDSENSIEFNKINYIPSAFNPGNAKSRFSDSYHDGLRYADGVLRLMINEIDAVPERIDNNRALEIIINLCSRFHLFVGQLKSRYGSRTPVSIDDEYDVQYIMHALLRMHFADIRPEEAVPSHAGAASRIDFLLKSERIAIETKMMRPNLSIKSLGEQLITDIGRYRSHQWWDSIVFFIFDPDRSISNPAGMKDDIEKRANDKKIVVIINPPI